MPTRPPGRRTAAVALALFALALLLVCGEGIARAHPLLEYRSRFSGPKEMALFVKGCGGVTRGRETVQADSSSFSRARIRSRSSAARSKSRRFAAFSISLRSFAAYRFICFASRNAGSSPPASTVT